MRAGFTGEGASSLTEVTADGERPIDLPDTGPPYAAALDHTLACLRGDAGNLIDPASALPALEQGPEHRREAAQAHFLLGVVHLGEGQVELAKSSFRDALRWDPALRLGREDYSPRVQSVFDSVRREAGR